MLYKTEQIMRVLAIVIIIAVSLAIVYQVLNLFENDEDGKTRETAYKILKMDLENDPRMTSIKFSEKKPLEQEVPILTRFGPVKPSSLPKISTPLDSTMFLISTYDQYGTIVSRTIYWKDLMKAINDGRTR